MMTVDGGRLRVDVAASDTSAAAASADCEGDDGSGVGGGVTTKDGSVLMTGVDELS